MDVNVDDICEMSITPNGGGNFVDAFWTGGDAPYSQLQACPASGNPSLMMEGSTGILADVGTVLAGAIWSTPLATAPTVTESAGIITVTDDTCVLTYRVSASDVSSALLNLVILPVIRPLTYLLYIFLFHVYLPYSFRQVFPLTHYILFPYP